MSEGEGLGERLLSISLSSAVFTPFTGPQVIDRGKKSKQIVTPSGSISKEDNSRHQPEPQTLLRPLVIKRTEQDMQTREKEKEGFFYLLLTFCWNSGVQ